jgi:hypothetical protein
MTSLYTLNLSDNNIKDITALQSLTELGFLDLSGNEIYSVYALQDLEYLMDVDISDNNITNIAPLSKLELWFLDVSQNYLDLTEGSQDMTFIQNMIKKNEYLTIFYEQQKEISPGMLPVITVSPYTTKPTNQNITVTASTNKGTLNAASHTFTKNGSFDFVATSAEGYETVETVTITNIDKTAPVITIQSYSKTPTTSPVTVKATTSDGTLNKTSYTFTKNGSFTFVATDAAGNKATKEVTITNIVVKGDVTGDGKVNVLDLLKSQKYMFGEIKFTEYEVLSADVTGDGKVNVLDLLKIQKYMFGEAKL